MLSVPGRNVDVDGEDLCSVSQAGMWMWMARTCAQCPRQECGCGWRGPVLSVPGRNVDVDGEDLCSVSQAGMWMWMARSCAQCPRQECGCGWRGPVLRESEGFMNGLRVDFREGRGRGVALKYGWISTLSHKRRGKKLLRK